MRPECVIHNLPTFILDLLIPIFLPSSFLVLFLPFHKTNTHKRALYWVCINTTELLSRPRTVINNHPAEPQLIFFPVNWFSRLILVVLSYQNVTPNLRGTHTHACVVVALSVRSDSYILESDVGSRRTRRQQRQEGDERSVRPAAAETSHIGEVEALLGQTLVSMIPLFVGYV